MAARIHILLFLVSGRILLTHYIPYSVENFVLVFYKCNTNQLQERYKGFNTFMAFSGKFLLY